MSVLEKIIKSGKKIFGAALLAGALYASPFIIENAYAEEAQETQEVRLENKAKELEEIYKKTFWGIEIKPLGLHDDVPKIVSYGDVAVPVSVKYFTKGRLDQRKTAMKVLLKLSEKIDDKYVDDIVNAYFSEKDGWTKREMSSTVRAILASTKGKAERIAEKYAQLLKSEDRAERKTAANILGLDYIPSDEYFKDVLEAYEKEKVEDIKQNLAYNALAKLFLKRKDLALEAQKGNDDLLRTVAIYVLAKDSETSCNLEHIINDKNHNPVERATAIIYFNDLDKRLDYILKIIRDPNENFNFRKTIMSEGLEVYIREEFNTRWEEKPIKPFPIEKYEKIRKELLDLSNRKTDDFNEKLLQVQAALELNTIRTIGGTITTFEYYDDSDRVKSVKTRTRTIPGESINGHLVVLYYQRAENYIQARDLENAEKDLHRGMVLAQEIPSENRNKVFEYLPKQGEELLEKLKEKDTKLIEVLQEGINYINRKEK